MADCFGLLLQRIVFPLLASVYKRVGPTTAEQGTRRQTKISMAYISKTHYYLFVGYYLSNTFHRVFPV